MTKELKKTYTFKLKPSIREKLNQLAVKANISSSAYIEKMLSDAEKLTERYEI